MRRRYYQNQQTMIDQYVNILQKQIDKLEEKDFDLKSWQIYTIPILDRIFGEGNRKSRQIEELKYEFGSWSLRDASGAQKNKDTVRSMAHEILEAAILELQNFGIPEQEKTGETAGEDLHFVHEALQDELKGSQYKEIRKILEAERAEDEKRSDIEELLKGLDNDALLNILTQIIMDPKIANDF